MTAENPEKLRLFSNVFLAFLSIKTFFFRGVLRDTVWQPAWILRQEFGVSVSNPENKSTKKKFPHKKSLSSANFSSGSVECCFDNPDENFDRKFEHFKPNCRFWIFFSNLFFLEIILWICVLQFWSPALIFWRKISKINRQFAKLSKEIQKKFKETLRLKMFLWPLKTNFRGRCWKELSGKGNFPAPSTKTFEKY